MNVLIGYFRRVHHAAIDGEAARRLARAVRGMQGVDPGIRIGVMGYDLTSRMPRRMEDTLGELRAALGRRRRVA